MADRGSRWSIRRSWARRDRCTIWTAACFCSPASHSEVCARARMRAGHGGPCRLKMIGATSMNFPCRCALRSFIPTERSHSYNASARKRAQRRKAITRRTAAPGWCIRRMAGARGVGTPTSKFRGRTPSRSSSSATSRACPTGASLPPAGSSGTTNLRASRCPIRRALCPTITQRATWS